MNEKILRLGLIGKDVSKSTSHRVHAFILNEWGISCEYEKFSVPKTDFDSVMRRLLGDFDGFNITIPYKRDVLAYLDEVCGDALACGAVNTVVTATGRGYNTDVEGFMVMIRNAKIPFQDKKILVLGGGGAGRSVAAALKKNGARVHMYQRTSKELQETCAELGITAVENPEEGGYDMLVNCTGVGMHESVGVSPVTAKAFAGASAAVDLIYEPSESEFLKIAKGQGCQTLNGKAMLFYQAYFADCLYAGRAPTDSEAQTLYEKYKGGESL